MDRAKWTYRVLQVGCWAYLILALLLTFVMLVDVIELEGGMRLIAGTPWGEQTIASLVVTVLVTVVPPSLLVVGIRHSSCRRYFGFEVH